MTCTLLHFEPLDEQGLAVFEHWARMNYVPGEPVDTLWHPATRVECERMNLEYVQTGSCRVAPEREGP
jgi:hypothetical protein